MDLSEKTTDRVGGLLKFRSAKEHQKSSLRAAEFQRAVDRARSFHARSASYLLDRASNPTARFWIDSAIQLPTH
jgi:hypothetical protein